MVAISPNPHSFRPVGFVYLEELGEVTTNVDGVTGMAAVTDHNQTLGTSVGNVIIWRGLTPDAEYMLDAVGAAGAAIATTVQFMCSPTATVITGTLLSAAPTYSLRSNPRLSFRMLPGQTRFGIRQFGTGGGTVSIYRVRA